MAQKANAIEMDATWVQFLTLKVNTFVKWDLVRFFHNNPHAQDTAESIARYIGRDVQMVQRELDELVAAAIVERAEKTSVPVYRFSALSDIRKLVADFMAACNNRDFRVQAINRLVAPLGLAPQRDL